jgi:hypothetical protein
MSEVSTVSDFVGIPTIFGGTNMRFSVAASRAIRRKIQFLFFPMLAIAGIGICKADVPNLYFQGFETDTSGWFQDSNGDGNGSITRVPSGGGSLGLTAADGSYYAEVQNNTNASFPGYGSGGFSYFEGDGTNPTPYPGSPYYQSIDVYINTTTPTNTSGPGVPAYWIDMFPTTTAAGGDPYCGQIGCGDEHNFRLSYNGSSVDVSIDGGSSIATISTSGWYQFEATYAPGATPSSDVQTEMEIFDSMGNLVGSEAVVGDSDGESLMSSDLGGPGLVWLPEWENGFSNNVLGIDDVEAGTLASVPEPSPLIILAMAFCGMVVWRRKSRKAASAC